MSEQPGWPADVQRWLASVPPPGAGERPIDRVVGAQIVAAVRAAHTDGVRRGRGEALLMVKRTVERDVITPLTVLLGLLELVLVGRAASPEQAQDWLQRAASEGQALTRAVGRLAGRGVS